MPSVRRLLLTSCLAVGGITASAFNASAQTYGAQPGDLGYFITNTTPTGGGTRLDLYKMSLGGVATEMHQDIFPDNENNSFSASDYT
mgnify:CR=1 FL=1